MIEIQQTIPTLRIFDEAKAKAFYVDWLGFTVDWENRFEENTPIFIQISLGSLTIHLSEHHGDCTPGSKIFIRCKGLKAYHANLMAKDYRFYRPHIKREFWDADAMSVMDPFGNKLLFSEDVPTQ